MTMANPPLQDPWYKKSILPHCLPGWLFACILCGAAAALTFGAMLRNWDVWRIALLFAGGFGVMLFILTMTQVKYWPAKQESTFLPPWAVCFPVFMGLAVGIAAIWIDERKISAGGRAVILEGPAVSVFAALVMLAAGVASTFFLRRRPFAVSTMVSGAIGLLIAVAGLTFAVIRISQRGL